MKRRCTESKPTKATPAKLRPKRALVPVNPDHWSEGSKRSVTYWVAPAFYKDIQYQCKRCGKTAVFSATEQKLSYESKKSYIHQRRLLCPDCWKTRVQIEHDLKRFAAQWLLNKQKLKRDPQHLAQWLKLLADHPEYGGRRNTALISMLKKLLKQTCGNAEMHKHVDPNWKRVLPRW
jgi:hypothetical protein